MKLLSRIFFFFLFFLVQFQLKAQLQEDSLSADDSLSENLIQDITVTSFRRESVKRSAIQIQILDTDSLKRYGNFNATDMLARQPGLSMLSTGVAISKPVIRGAYGNRVLILLNGLKFDNQQWQEEHGMGLSDLGLGRIEIIKGPLSVLYGSEALGGIINLIEEDKPLKGKTAADINFRFNTNTRGGLLHAGFFENKGRSWNRIRIGTENHGDYSDGSGKRVLNSRFDGYYLKYTHGFRKRNWESVNNYAGSFNRFGFIFNDVYTFITPDARWSRDLSVNPNHMVLLNVFSSQNNIRINQRQLLSVNAGIQSNRRMENEGGGQISLDMHLITAQYLAKWHNKLGKRSNLTVTNLGNAVDNTNFGGRKIIPDARMQEFNTGGYLETRVAENLMLENGISAGYKRIRTFFTPGVNSPDKEIAPFEKNWLYYNAFSGISLNTRQGFSAKANIASGVRVPNLAELASNGLHEGVFTYETGNPNFKTEQLAAGNLFLGWQKGKWDFYASPFYNYYHNYIYLSPTNETWFGFPVARFKQQNATQTGAEFFVQFKVSRWQLSSGFSGMVSKTADGAYTPYLPAKKMNPQLQFLLINNKGFACRLFTSSDLVWAQRFTASGEPGSQAYQLINAGFNCKKTGKHRTWDFSLAGNNLLNQRYIDNLSRFKYFGIYQIGRNFAMNCRISANK